MDNPVLAEVTRGGHVESRHRGSFAVVDGDGKLVLLAGDIARPVFPRSSVKAMQALALVESGAADALGLTDEELALACGSHVGEERHADLAAAMLARAGLEEADLECGAHWSADEIVLIGQARSPNAPGPLLNNCSGKHSGFLCTCHHLGFGLKGYVRREHPIQSLIAATMEQVTGAPHRADNAGIDGCAIPTYAIPLRAFATGFARMATGRGLEPVRAMAARRLIGAAIKNPWVIAGTGRFDTRMMEGAGGRIFTKSGAEGVFAAAIPELGYGIAIKCDDGAERAAEAMVAGLLAHLLKSDDALQPHLRGLAVRILRNRNGDTVGEVRPAGPLALN
ncbi:MAG: asparaginase [Notoacmeibacter sp.]|nr:asparaginase [Notoacmeibacter sp.]